MRIFILITLWLTFILIASRQPLKNYYQFKRSKCQVELTFKACICYFLSNCPFSPNDSSSKTMKNVFLFHLKNSFRSRDIHIFVFSFSTLFFPVSHCLRAWSKKNLKTCDVISCLIKNLITHFVSYLENEIRCNIETLFIDRALNKEHFYEKIMQKMCTKS